MPTLRVRLLGLIIVLVGGCADEPETVTVGFQHDELTGPIIDRLKAEDVWFEVLETGEIRFRKEDLDTVNALAADVAGEILPDGRATSFATPAFEKQFTKRLDAAGIAYETRLLSGERWITWSAEDDSRVQEILHETYRAIGEAGSGI